MLKRLLALVLLGVMGLISPSLADDDSISVEFEDIGTRTSDYSNGSRIFLTNNLDYPVCYLPAADREENIDVEWTASIIKLEPGEKTLVGRVMVRNFNEDWAFTLGGDFNGDCL